MMRKDVTDLFEEYRECARHLRNTNFSLRHSQDFDLLDDFDDVATALFRRLVLYRIRGRYAVGVEEAVQNNQFLIIPAGVRMGVMISADTGQGGAWDYPLNLLEPGDALIAFRRHFDWDDCGLIDFRYYFGEIIMSEKYPDVTGHFVLIETHHAKVVYDDGGANQ